MAFRNVYVAGGNGIGYTVEVDSSGDYGSVSNDTYFKDLSKGIGGMIHYKSDEGNIFPVFDMSSITVTGSLTASQINDLDNTPITIIPAVAGKIIVLESVAVEYVGGGTAYTVSVSGNIELGYGPSEVICQFCSYLVLGGTTYAFQLSQTVAGADVYTSAAAGSPIQVFSGTPISDGTSDIYYSIKYRLVDCHI